MKRPSHTIWFSSVSALVLSLSACSQSPGGAPKFLGTNPATPNVSTSGNPSGGFGVQAPVQKLIYHVGPVDLMAGQALDATMEKPAKLNFQVGSPVWVVGFEPKVIDADGKPLSGNLLHKAILFNKHENNPVCANSSNGNPFAVATSTLTKLEMPEGFGYPVLPEDPLEAKAVFQNTTKNDYFGIYFSFELIAVPMEKAKGMGDVRAILLDADPCEHKPMAIEPGAFVEKSQTFTLQQEGSLMVANGMLSDYGVAVSLTHQEPGNASLIPFWRAEAVFDEDHRIINLSPNPFIDPSGKRIAKGDKLTLGISFDNFSNEWHDNATGAAMVYLSPSENE